MYYGVEDFLEKKASISMSSTVARALARSGPNTASVGKYRKAFDKRVAAKINKAMTPPIQPAPQSAAKMRLTLDDRINKAIDNRINKTLI